MQDTPKGERLHIAIFGKRNAGKSSLINALTKQDVALVSDLPGTTTDPVYKAMEILPLGPVVLIDTAGLDDEGQLGLLRVEKSKAVLNKTDLAILVIDGQSELTEFDVKIFQEIKAKNIPIVVVVNKIDSASKEGIDLVHKKDACEVFGMTLPLLISSTGQKMGKTEKSPIRCLCHGEKPLIGGPRKRLGRPRRPAFSREGWFQKGLPSVLLWKQLWAHPHPAQFIG